MTGGHGAQGIGIQTMLKTLVFNDSDGNWHNGVTTNAPNGVSKTPNHNFCKLRMTFDLQGMEVPAITGHKKSPA